MSTSDELIAPENPAPENMEIPGPRERLPVRRIREYDKDRLQFLLRNHERYGDIFRFDAASVIVRHPGVIHDVHVRTNTDFLSEEAVLSGADPDTTGIENRMRARRPAWKALRPGACLQYGALITDRFAALLDGLDGQPFSPVPVLTQYTSAVLTDICLGQANPRVAEAVQRRFDAFLVLMNRSWRRPRWLPDPTLDRARDADLALDAALLDHLAAHEPAGSTDTTVSAGNKGCDLASTLLNAADPGLPLPAVADFVKGTLLAAHGVPAVALAWIMYALATDTVLAERVTAEAAAHPDLTDAYARRQLPLAEAVVNEVLRLHPPTWLMGRRVHRDTTLAGYRLRAGQTVLFSPYLVHRDPRWWGTDADTLNPDRWLGDSQGGARHKHAYIPFSAGTRVCIGSALGTTLLVLCTAHLAKHHRVRPHSTGPVRPEFGAMLTPRGLQLRCDPVDLADQHERRAQS